MSTRTYTDRTIKILWGMSRGRCNFPSCKQVCIELSVSNGDFIVLGKIAHIYSFKEGGPRGNPKGLTEKELNDYPNLLVLCPTHHDLVDGDATTYSDEVLLDWKLRVEDEYYRGTTNAAGRVTFRELEEVAKAILAQPLPPTSQFEVTSPVEKMRKNELTQPTARLLKIGYVNTPLVEDYVSKASLLEPNFPERLKAGFLFQYIRLKERGMSGDPLFQELHNFTYNSLVGQDDDFLVMATGLSVLVYLFQSCEIFES